MAKLRGGTRIYGTGTVDTILYVNGDTVASSTSTGALQVAGGVGIGGNLYVGGVFSATSITIGGTNVGYGYTGSFGYTGSLGYTGSIGVGYTGSASTASGYTGSIGVGYTGSASTETGYTGSLGYTGSKGNDGTSVTIQGSVATYTLLPGYPSSYGGATGDGYITTDTGHLWVWSGSIWNDVGQIKGDTGDIGYTGSIGIGYTGSASTEIGYTGSIGVGYTGSASTEIGYTGSQGAGGGAGYTGSASTASGYTGSLGYTGSIGESSYTYSENPPVSPAVGDRWFDSSSGLEFVWTDDSNSTQWIEIAASGFLGQTGYVGSRGALGPLHWTIALTDEISNIATGVGQVTLRAPFAMTLTSIPRASLGTASSSGVVTADIKVDGASILGANKLTIDATEKTSTTATTPTTVATSTIADDAEITFDITAAGTSAVGLKVTLYYSQT